ncbi:MAG: transglutaminase domain-containing protein [Gammaproteobacteria bacterium]|nr:transglutaminase domain-containing protein [Gammaproteobacteria bacterium]
MSDAPTRLPMPPGWPVLALLGWGWLTDALAGAAVMAALLAGLGVAPVKWNVARRDFHRAADLSSVLFAVITVVQFQRYSVHGVYEILRVVPYAFFPLMLVQRASVAQAIPLSALVYGLRRHAQGDRPIDVTPHFVAACVLAACTTAREDLAYAAFAALVLGGVLVAARPRRYRAWQFALALLLAVALGAAAEVGMRGAQRALEAGMLYWFNQFPWSGGDPNRAFTAIGAIGRLKLSDQIRVRVTPAPGLTLPLFLQEASYDSFKYGTWTAADAPFAAIDKLPGANRWALGDDGETAAPTLEITFQHARELALLPLPRGARTVASDEIAELQRNRFGAIMAEAPPGALRYTADAPTSGSRAAAPRAADRAVPAAYAAVVARVNAEAGVTGDDAATDAARVNAFFHDNFTYTLVQRGSFGRRLPLAHFLEKTRRGHCEYFASAAVLMLRSAGIPARYAVGYVVENYSALERAYIARARHAHAWALAWVDGQWQVVDATPSVWFDLEEARASRWQRVGDLVAWLWYRFQRLGQADLSEAGDLLLWLVPPLALVLYLRLRRSPTAVPDERRREAAPPAPPPMPLDPLLAALAARGLEPAPGETIATFLARAAPAAGGGESRVDLVATYYRWRFDAAGTVDRGALEARVARYLSAL